MAGFKLAFSKPLSPVPARAASNYFLTRNVVRHHEIVAQRLRVKPTYKRAKDVVILRLTRSATFPAGGQLLLNASPPHGIVDTTGEPLNPTSAALTIAPHARNIETGTQLVFALRVR